MTMLWILAVFVILVTTLLLAYRERKSIWYAPLQWQLLSQTLSGEPEVTYADSRVQAGVTLRFENAVVTYTRRRDTAVLSERLYVFPPGGYGFKVMFENTTPISFSKEKGHVHEHPSFSPSEETVLFALLNRVRRYTPLPLERRYKII